MGRVFEETSSSSVEAVKDFSVLKKIATADRLGCLFASAIQVECSLLNQPYDEVIKVMDVLRNSSLHYDFTHASIFLVNKDSDWVEIQEKLRLCPVEDNCEYFIYNSIPMDESSFYDLREFLKGHRCLLLGVPSNVSSGLPPSAEQGMAASARFH